MNTFSVTKQKKKVEYYLCVNKEHMYYAIANIIFRKNREIMGSSEVSSKGSNPYMSMVSSLQYP